MRDELESDGFVHRARFISEAALESLLAACVSTGAKASVHFRSGAAYGVRGLLWEGHVLVSELAEAGADALATEALGSSAFPIDAIFFDKQTEANWSVPGHQDRLMPVMSGTAPKPVRKNGIDYAEPSLSTLEGLIAVRIHFDDADVDGGALQVLPGSHRDGVLDVAVIRSISLGRYRACPVSRGDVALMRPLLLHRSGRRVVPGHRRVLHVVYARQEPEGGLRWRRTCDVPSTLGCGWVSGEEC